jgi:hypothetical protein
MFFMAAEDYDARIEECFGGAVSVPFLGLTFLLLILTLLVLVGNGHLIGFHVFLKTKGLTTYRYIMQRREKLAQQAWAKVEMEQN